MFEQFDVDMSGDISVAEFERGLTQVQLPGCHCVDGQSELVQQLGIKTSEQELSSMFEMFDVNQSGMLSKDDFHDAVLKMLARSDSGV